MSQWVKERPWIWIVVLLGSMVASSLVLVWISVHHPPIPVGLVGG